MLVKENQQNKKVLILGSYRYNLSEINEIIELFFDSKIEVVLPQEMKKIEFETINVMERFLKRGSKLADYIYVYDVDGEIELSHIDVINNAISNGKSVYFSCMPKSKVFENARQEFYDQTMIINPQDFAALVKFEDDVWRQRQFFSGCSLIQKEA